MVGTIELILLVIMGAVVVGGFVMFWRGWRQ